VNNDLLLEWASERGEGSWQQLRDAQEWILSAYPSNDNWQPTPGFSARMLATLGHLEVDWTNGRWTATPPLLTLLPSAGAHALLTGARTRWLFDRLSEVTKDDRDLYVLPVSQRLAPTAILIACADETNIESLAKVLGIGYEFSVSERLSGLLPELDSYLALAPVMPAPRGYGVARFNVATLAWQDADTDSRPGFYRYEAYGRPIYRLIDDEHAVHEVDLAIGAWAALSRWGENRLSFKEDVVNGTLVVPIGTPLPTLHARTAALCSGLAPGRVDGFLWYRNVPRHIGVRIARSVDQTLVDLPVGR
jgi:hypothetical protein